MNELLNNFGIFFTLIISFWNLSQQTSQSKLVSKTETETVSMSDVLYRLFNKLDKTSLYYNTLKLYLATHWYMLPHKTVSENIVVDL